MNSHSSLEDQFNCIVEVVRSDFSDIAVDVQLRFTTSGAVERLRIFLLDESFVDVWLSRSGKYSYHWEQRHVEDLFTGMIMHRTINGRKSKLFLSISMTAAKTT